MRHRWILLASACGGVDATPDAPTLPPDLVLYYPMDDAVASGTVRDKTGHQDGYCTGGSCPTKLEIGRIDGALIFDGDDMIRIPSTAELGSLAALTVSLWVGREADGPACMIGKRVGTSEGNTWQLCVNASNAVTLTSYDGTANVVTATPATLTGSWNHLALTWDASTQTETFHVEGEVISSVMVAKVWDSSELLIGGDVDDDTPTSFFTGVIDDVRIYRRALSAVEIRDLTRR